MERSDEIPEVFSSDDTRLIHRLTQLPQKILRYHDLDGLADLAVPA